MLGRPKNSNPNLVACISIPYPYNEIFKKIADEKQWSIGKLIVTLAIEKHEGKK